MLKLSGAFSGASEKFILGFDLGDDVSGMSYITESGEMETVSTVAGREVFEIPTCLCKRPGAGQWFFGEAARKFAREEGGILVEGLLEKAVSGEPVTIDGTSYKPASLLTLFLKRCLGLLTQLGGESAMEGLLITVPVLDHNTLEALREAVAGLKLGSGKVWYQSYAESYYAYMIHQEEDLWLRGSLLLRLSGGDLQTFRMETNRHTKPVVVYIDEQSYPFPEAPRSNRADEDYEQMQRDRMLLNQTREIIGPLQLSSVFLIGEDLSGDWMQESLKFLCKQGRVFRGTNLFSKGACYGLQDRLKGTEAAKEHVFLGNEKLTCNVGMKILRHGEETYFALLDAGVDWFEASEEFDFYMEGGNEIDLHISSLVGGGSRTARIFLEGYSGEMTRMRASLYLTDVRHLVIRIEDLGLGEFSPSSMQTWKEEIEL